MYEAGRSVCRREWRLPVRGILLAAVLIDIRIGAIPARADTAYGYILPNSAWEYLTYEEISRCRFR